MLPWLSGGMLKCAIALSFGWITLAALAIAATNGAIHDADAHRPGPRINKVIQIDGTDPCTNELIVLDTHAFVDATSTIDGSQIRTEGVMTLTGWVETGTARTDLNVAARQPVAFNRAATIGKLAPVEVRLTVVDRPSLPVTVLAVPLQGSWDGSHASLAIMDAYLDCA
jgi:hypothetical protein